MQINCPSCGGEAKFKSKASVFSVCPFCKSMLVRHDMNLEALGKMAELQGDVSPLQIGTLGQYQGRSFELIGRLQVSWEAGGWNEWFMYFSDGREGWLAEAQGFYMVSFHAQAIANLPEIKGLTPGVEVQIRGQLYKVDDIKNAICSGSQGELPFKAPQGRQSMSVDLSTRGNGFACIDFSVDGTEVYVGKYVEFDDLKFQSLRSIDGW